MRRLRSRLRSVPDVPTPNAPGGGALGTILDKLLAFVDRPWKALALAALILVGGLVYIVYLQRAELTQALVRRNERFTAELQPAKFSAQVEKLMPAARADSVAIYAIDMRTNTLSLKYNKSVDGIGAPSPAPRPVILGAQDAVLFLTLLQERSTCMNTGELQRPGAADALARGINRMCFVLIPPDPPLALGIIMIGWRNALPMLQEREAVLAGQNAAENMGTWYP